MAQRYSRLDIVQAVCAANPDIEPRRIRLIVALVLRLAAMRTVPHQAAQIDR